MQSPPPPPPPPPGPPWPGGAPGWAPGGAPAYGSGFGGRRPQSASELLESVFGLYRRNFLLFLSVSAIIQVPFAILSLAVRQQAQLTSDSYRSLLSGTADAQTIRALAILFLISLFGGLVVNTMVTGAMARAVSDRHLDRPTSLALSYQTAWQQFPSLLGFSLLLMLITAAGGVVLMLVTIVVPLLGILAMLAAIPLLVFAYVRVVLGPAIIVLERLGPVAALQRSWHLVKGLTARTFGIILLLVIIVAVLGFLVAAIATGFAVIVGSGALAQIFGVAITAALAPLSIIMLVLLYYDTRLRREGLIPSPLS